jgi:integration host factor subunit beta
MTRSELVALLAKRFPLLSLEDTDIAVKEILEALSETLVQGRRVEIRGFGSFCLKYKAPRLARNPKTGEKIPLPARHVPHFKAGKEMRRVVMGNDPA